MKFLFDFFPVLLFFISYKVFDIYVATAVAIAASFLQVALSWWQHHRIETMHIVTFGLIVVFGGATLVLQNEIFIKWKPTILNWLFGLVFLASQLFGRQPIIQRMLGGNITLTEAVWVKLNGAWSVFFILLGAVNLYIAYTFETDIWVNFKLFGMMGLTVLFVILQTWYIARYIKEDDIASEERD